MDASLARAVWRHLELVNAVTYFSPECIEGPARLGLRGFWMGYFANRAAPLGAAGPGLVEATFFNFHPDRVRRALPDAWTYAAPAEVLDARADAAAAALRRLLSDGRADRAAQALVPLLADAAARAVAPGRPLFAANRDVSLPDDPVAALWQLATTLREHRGDGHVALLAAADLDGCEVHVLFAAGEGVDRELYERGRGWSTDEWQAAAERLARRGLLGADGLLSTAGADLRADIERRTDVLAVAPYVALGDDRAQQLLDELARATAGVAWEDEVFFPNPMGLPKPGD